MAETTEPNSSEKSPSIKPVPTPTPPPDPEVEREKRQMKIMMTVGGIFLLIFIVGGVTLLMMAPGETTSKVRDVFIIFMALESLVIGVALIILMMQLATLVNLLNNELKPILTAMNETINTLRGTTEFLSENLVEPVVKINSYVAGLQRLLDMVGLKKK